MLKWHDCRTMGQLSPYAKRHHLARGIKAGDNKAS